MKHSIMLGLVLHLDTRSVPLVFDAPDHERMALHLWVEVDLVVKPE